MTDNFNIPEIHKLYFVSTRFNNYTWNENQTYLMENNNNKYFKCIYGSPQPIAITILNDAWVFVCEMNNDVNQLMGIGLIKNRIYADKSYKIYSLGNYNRYVYKGKYYINREELLRRNTDILQKLEQILFKGKGHSKRGIGFTTISNLKLLQNLKNDIRDLFITRFYSYSQSNNTLLAETIDTPTNNESTL